MNAASDILESIAEYLGAKQAGDQNAIDTATEKFESNLKSLISQTGSSVSKQQIIDTVKQHNRNEEYISKLRS